MFISDPDLTISEPQSPRKNGPTRPFTILELRNPSPDVPELHEIRRYPDLEALKLRKGWSGESMHIYVCSSKTSIDEYPDATTESM